MKVGDRITRMLWKTIPMQIKITKITSNRIICGPWEFDKETGIEIDDDVDCPISRILLTKE